jgi:CRISPR/Cas system-associated exonuclease Cas4 (RecB family)
MIDITQKIHDLARSHIKQYPCHANRASAIGHECERHLYYMRTAWDQAQPHDVGLQQIFEEGQTHEASVLKSLAEAGIDVIEQQQSLYDPQYKISGHVDGVLNIGQKAVPLEIKSMSPNIWASIFRDGARRYPWREVEDRFQAKPWLKKYHAQLTIYMFLKDNDQAVLLCKNKSSGAIAQVDIDLDFDYAEALIQKAERINNAVKDETPPDRTPFSNEVCRSCEFNHLCCPYEVALDPFQTISDAQLEEWCMHDYMYEGAAKLRADARKNLLAYCKAHPDLRRAIVGPYTIVATNGKTRTTVKVQKFTEIAP